MKIALAAIALVAGSGCAFAQKYVITELGQLPEVGAGFNGDIGGPSAINDKGQIVGFSYLNGVLIPHAMIWNGTRPTGLGTLGGGSSIAKGINDKGQVVGWAETRDGNRHATIWNGTTPSDLGTLGGPFSEAAAINDAGEVVGDSSLLLNPDFFHAAVWNSKMPAEHVDLGTLGGDFSLALGINAAGQITGYSFTSGGFSAQAVIWQASPATGIVNVTQLHTLGGNNGNGFAINNLGQVAGFSDTAHGTSHAALWSGVDPIDLGTLGGMPTSVASGLNDKGQVVGVSFARGPTIAVLWQDGKVVDLNTLIAGPLAAHRTLNQAAAINNKGVITGRGSDNLTGAIFMFVLTPVAEALAELRTEVRGVGPGKSLGFKVKLAEAYYSARDIEATCAVLAGFTHEVKALAGDRIDGTLAKRLVADATAIEDAIGCGAAHCKFEKGDDHDKDHGKSHCHERDDDDEADND